MNFARLNHLTLLSLLVFSCSIDLKADIVFSETGFGDTVSKYDIEQGTVTNLVNHAGLDPRSIAVDSVNEHIYYSYGVSVARVNLDGTGRVDIKNIGLGVTDIEVDPIAGKLYFSTNGGALADRTIRSMNLDGSSESIIHDNASLAGNAFITTNAIVNLSIDIDTGFLYWTADDGGNAGRIGFNRSSTSGSGVTQLWKGAGRFDSISKMEIDFDDGKMYYTVGSTTNEVRRSNLDNTFMETLVSGAGRPAAIGLDLDNQELYFSVGGTLYNSELDGSSLTSTTLNFSTLYSISDLEYVSSASSIPEPASTTIFLFGLLSFMTRRPKKIS